MNDLIEQILKDFERSSLEIKMINHQEKPEALLEIERCFALYKSEVKSWLKAKLLEVYDKGYFDGQVMINEET